MLKKLVIKNYLLLRNIEIDFSNGFNVIIGETGAGKTILINALLLLLGERADYSNIEKNKEKMLIEGLFEITNNISLNNFIKSLNIEKLDYGLILRRELYSKGYSRCFINDTPVNIKELKKIGDLIVDIHSQNEHQTLLRKETHLELLDSYSENVSNENLKGLKDIYSKYYIDLTNLINKYNNTIKKKNETEEKKDFLEFQLMEIRQVNPQPEEEKKLERELKIAENIETIQRTLISACDELYDKEGSILEKIKEVKTMLEKVSMVDKEIQDTLKETEQIQERIKEISRQVKEHLNKINIEPEKVEEMRKRLYSLNFLKKKYGTDTEGIIEIAKKAEQDLMMLDDFESKIREIKKQTEELKEKAYTTALKISQERKKCSAMLKKEVEKYLRELGLENAEFNTSIKNITADENDIHVAFKREKIKLTKEGIDDIEFMIKTNKGDTSSPLRKTASGGEVSRIMLAIKTVLSGADQVGTLVFDEIDTGISGRIAQKTGKVIKKLSESSQIIAVTHLAQIAAQADEHFIVEKETEGDSTTTKIRKLNKQEKIKEIARLLSGEKITEASMKSAEQLIN